MEGKAVNNEDSVTEQDRIFGRELGFLGEIAGAEIAQKFLKVGLRPKLSRFTSSNLTAFAKRLHE
jgi:hypothetical protein